MGVDTKMQYAQLKIKEIETVAGIYKKNLKSKLMQLYKLIEVFTVHIRLMHIYLHYERPSQTRNKKKNEKQLQNPKKISKTNA